MGHNWGRQVPGGPHVGHINFAIWVIFVSVIESGQHPSKIYSGLGQISIRKSRDYMIRLFVFIYGFLL